jgi:hypothetical protein
MDNSAQIVLETTEAEVVPGQTARYPFTVRAGGGPPLAGEFGVVSDHAGFNPRWVRVVRATDALRVTRYLLEVTPDQVRRDQYGQYPLRIYREPAEAQCVLIIRPAVRLTGKPVLATRPGGTLTLSIENFGRADVDVEISVEHQGSNWSQGWEFELEAGAGPIKISEEFEPPEDGHRGTFTVTVSAAGVQLFEAELAGRTLVFPRKAVVTAAVLAGGAALGTALALALAGQAVPAHVTSAQSAPPAPSGQQQTGTPESSPVESAGPSPSVTATGGGGADGAASGAKQAQSITFSSTAPASAAPGDTYVVTATGGASGEPLTFAIDASSGPVCSIAGSTVTLSQPGDCLIDANQAGNGQFLAAPRAQQSVAVAKLPQTIIFNPPGSATEKSSGTLTATGGPSGEPVTFTVDPSSSPDACQISGLRILYEAPNTTCVIDADEAGTDRYAAAQVQRTVSVTPPPSQPPPQLSGSSR